MTYQCQICKKKEFHIIDGQSYCSECNTLSRAHGLETVVDDDTLGIVNAQGDQLLNTKKKKLGSSHKRRRKKAPRRDRYITSFTTAEALTYLLKGWTEDLIDIGAPESLKATVKLMWMKYLSKIGISIEAEKVESKISNAPTFRDLQVTILGRKKVLQASELKKRKNFASCTKASNSTVSFDDFDQEVDTKEIKKLRRKRRRSFLKGLSSDLGTSDASLSSLNISLLEESNDFTLSIASDMNSSEFTEISSTNDTAASETESFKDELTKERREIDKAVLRGISYRRKKTVVKPGHRALTVSSGRAMEILAFSLLLTDGHAMTLSDIIFFTDTNGIAYKTPTQHLPPVMRLHSIEDVSVITPRNWLVISHSRLRNQIRRLGIFLGCNSISASKGLFANVFKRYLSDLSLPESLFQITWELLDQTKWLEGRNSSLAQYKMALFDSNVFYDVKACATILFILKYFYGLDGESEIYHGANAALFNKINSVETEFNICEWIKMSRVRTFLITRHSSDLHKRFSGLFPMVILCPNSQVEGFKRFAKIIEKRRQKVIPENSKMRSADYIRSYLTKGDLERFTRVRDFCQNLKESISSRRTHIQHPNFVKSLKPLTEFSQFFSTCKPTCCILDDEERKSLSQLLDMRQCQVHQEWDFEVVENVTLKGDWFIQFHDHHVDKKDRDYKKSFSHKRRPIEVIPNKKYVFERTYWHLRLSTQEPDFLTYLPESFVWILEYLSSYIGAKPYDIYNALVFLENEVLGQKGFPLGEFHRARPSSKFLSQSNPRAWHCLT